MPTITFEDVSVTFDGDVSPTLDRISLTLDEHRIGVIGANGSGKSTLARLINGLGEPTSGRVLVDAADVTRHGRDIRRRVGFVFSDAENQIVMPQVRDDVAFSLRRLKLSRAERDARVDAALARFGLTDLAENSPHTLSGGQKQLLALASVLVIEPDLIIADEPTTLLDLRNRARIAREFAALDQQLIVVTHDLDILADFDRVICLDDGRVIADGSPTEVCAHYRSLMLA
ncbi:ABC transport system, ATP-binding protein [Corynebacterium humireducens NBRC 106098 = DSM 45392]|uniref:ABC transport system, ATP-binding protein n=1 Tax=Corynebacterium humireducens NBRC 106098 = DSM 45392 TaxID=1223515 RepID=A0A0B5DBB7_9CORY|nr:ABC transporter ATP-binding protein [Corynebacterium humireducens]AJE33418.1 ABC transport system, ATP-binding protein [Corynebacterium humireducens NBRC 106098 = DSM 45392]